MKLRDAIRKLSLNDRRLQSVLLAFMLLFYGVILYKAGVHWPLNRTFNSMLDHLAHGQFDVDPNIVDREGFLRNGHVYAYWGITRALVGLPLLIFHRLDLRHRMVLPDRCLSCRHDESPNRTLPSAI